MCLASTTVTMPSRRYLALISSSTKNVCATGAGSASPVVSIRTASKLATLACMRFRAATRSPRTVQQMHPFMTSMTSSSVLSVSFALSMMCSSIPTSPNSFSMTANRMPPFSSRLRVRRWFSRVVLPLPRKPFFLRNWGGCGEGVSDAAAPCRAPWSEQASNGRAVSRREMTVTASTATLPLADDPRPHGRGPEGGGSRHRGGRALRRVRRPPPGPGGGARGPGGAPRGIAFGPGRGGQTHRSEL